MLSKELIKKIKKIEIKSNKIANDIFSGEYHSHFKGNGMEFEDIREYSYGDSIKSIDWNTTARQGKAYVKKFKEERELSLFLILDMSKSNSYGKKKDLIADIGATLAFSAVKNNDKVASLFFTETVEKFVPLKKGKKHVLSIIENILDFEPEKKGTNIKEAIRFFNNIQKRKSIVFLISDFLDVDYDKEVKILSKKHDLVLIRVIEKKEEKIPKGAIFSFRDLETGEEIVLDNTKKDRIINLKSSLPAKNVLNIYTDEDFIKPMMLFFNRKR